MVDAPSDEDRVELALRGLRMVRDAALEDGKASTVQSFDEFIEALVTGGDHPLLQRWLDHRRDNRTITSDKRAMSNAP